MSVDRLKARMAIGLAGGRSDQPFGMAAPTQLSPLVPALLIILFVPFTVGLGPAQLSVTRFYLLFLVVPLLRFLLLGRAGPLLVTDLAIMGLCLWVGVSMFKVHGGLAAVEGAVVFAIETMGGYLIGRCLVRHAEHFFVMASFMFKIVLFLLPFTLIEALAGVSILRNVANAIIYSQPGGLTAMRLGVHRAHATLNHPITYGFVIAAMLPLVYGVASYGRVLVVRLAKAFAVFLTTALTVSTGPLLMVAVQIGLYAADAILRRVRERWALLVILGVGLAIYELSTGVLIDFLINKVAFNANSASNRPRIFEWGLYNIRHNPIFGIGLNDWVRLPGMVRSADMFWIVVPMRHGIPAGALNLAAFVWIPLVLAFRTMPTPRLRSYKFAFIVCMVSCFVATWTVHLWGTPYVLYCFLLGSGAWMLDRDAVAASVDASGE